jgi:DNA (cytosine-5)-methyltransferase 1
MDLSDFERRETGTGTGTGTGTEPQPFWANATLLPCIDGKARRIEPGTFPLAHGIPGRVGLLRGYGNAIVPEVAAVFIRAFYEARSALIA